MSIKDKVLTLPLQPGCYLMKDKNGEVIYVGKAKKLRNRVSSYFVGTHNNKTTKMVSNVVDFDFIVAPSEKEALILEYNLIKQYKPRFNIMFMDDASYPYIRITKEKDPTLKLVRDKKKMKNAIYFGPYPNAGYARDLVELLNKLYPLRKCKTMSSKVCLYYHLGLCLGPCEYKIDKQVYDSLIKEITNFINGDTKPIVDKLRKQRDEYSEKMMFEKAGETQQLIEAIIHVTSNQIMQNNNSKKSVDVFSYYVDKGYISIVGLLYNEGKLLHRHLTLNPVYDDVEDTFISYLIQYYKANPLPKNLLLDKDVDIEGLSEILDTKIFQPIRGDKRKLVLLAQENAKINLDQKFNIISKQDDSAEEALGQLHDLINWPVTRIELFDNSHISGSDAVAGQVVYVNGAPSKKDYRLYKVTNGNDDYANMKEVIYRRLFNALTHKSVFPDIIIVDGGALQIKAAREIVDSLMIKTVKILGLVKNDKHQTSNLMDEDLQLFEIDRQSKLFYLLTQMQDEVHRFAITYHKKLRSKNVHRSALDNIDSIGTVRKNKLLKAFSTITAIKEASVEDLAKVVGNITAQKVYDHFHNKQ